MLNMFGVTKAYQNMKINSLITTAIISISLAACSSGDQGEGGNGDTVAVATPAEVESRSLCYIRTEGAGNRDTTSIELVIKENDVTGQMYWHPFEKDSRKGTLSGTLKDDTVHAVWSFMQEGKQDTLGLQFLMKGDSLLQKPLAGNAKTGRQQTNDNAGFTVSYRPSVSLKK